MEIAKTSLSRDTLADLMEAAAQKIRQLENQGCEMHAVTFFEEHDNHRDHEWWEVYIFHTPEFKETLS